MKSIPTCLLCHKPITFASPWQCYSEPHRICYDCYEKMSVADKYYRIAGCRSYSLFYYEGPVREVILQIKISRDLEVARALLIPYRHFLEREYRGYTMVAVPSTPETNADRGFNHVALIFGTLHLHHQDLFIKNQAYKQSDQSFANRKQVHQVIALNAPVDKKRKYLIVDDIVTSQETLKACIALLRKAGVKKIRCLTLAYNCRRSKSGHEQIRLK